MENKTFFENISDIKDSLRLYLETKISYFGITAFEKSVKMLTALTANGFVILLLWMALMFFSGAGAIYLGNMLESMELGLMIVGGFYIFLSIFFFVFRKKIFSPFIISILVNVLFKDDDDEENTPPK